MNVAAFLYGFFFPPLMIGTVLAIIMLGVWLNIDPMIRETAIGFLSFLILVVLAMLVTIVKLR